MGAETQRIVISVVPVEGTDADEEDRERVIQNLRRELLEAGADVTNVPGPEAPEGTRAVLGMTSQFIVELPVSFIAHVVAGVIYHHYSVARDKHKQALN